MKIRALAFVSFVVLGACGKPPAPPPRPPAPVAPPAPVSPLVALANDIEPKEANPLEPQMPLELRVALPPKEEALSSAELLRRAEDKVPPPSQASRDDYATTVTNTLLAIALAERAAAGEPPASIEASAFLVEQLWRLAARQGVAAMLRSSAASLENAEAQKVAAMLKGYEALAPQLMTHAMLHAARVLRAGAPRPAVVAVLWQLLRNADEASSFESMIAEYRRLKPVLDAEDLTRIAELHAQNGARATFDADVAAARAAIEKVDGAKRPLLARVARAERKRAAVERLATLRGDDVATRLERYTLLDDLARTKDADAELDALERAAPGDGRVRARLAHRAFRRGFVTKGLIEAASDGHAVLKAVPITAPSLDDAQLDLAFAGMEIATATAKLSESSKPSELVAAMAPVDASLERFAKLDADSAAGVVHAANRVRDLLSLTEKERAKKMDRVMRDGATEIAALRKRLPANVDLMRIALVYAARHPEPARGLALALDDAGYGSPPRDVDVALERVGTVLTLMADANDTKALPSMRAALDAIPPDTDEDREGLRQSLLADVAMFEALGNKGASWNEVARLYERAETMLSSQRARLRNNRAYALRRAGQDALTLWDGAAEGGAAGEPHVIAWLNVSLARGATFADLRPHAVPAAAQAMEQGMKETAIFLYRWLAENEPNAAAAKDWAQKVLALDGERPPQEFAPGFPLRCQNDNQIGLGLSTTALGYVFTARAVCRLWLSDARFATRRRLDTLAGKK
ncbi:MAG: hypothetical protein KIT84_28340 [Labilithrix sp.]|nr:hypothetical protein [Labilithrix sp.]MCW5814969.1 hypothetical protein [Labilithrix sp.]